MQTFISVDWSFVRSAKCLDNKRLWKQCLEGLQIYLSLTDPDYGWKNHPAVKMWHGYTYALLQYTFNCACECSGRGIAIGACAKIVSYITSAVGPLVNDIRRLRTEDKIADSPPWLYDGCELSKSHRAALLAKSYDWYKRFGWSEKPEINYFWPTKQGQTLLELE